MNKLNRFQVGGSVRDLLLGQDPKDIDWVVVGTTVAEMEALGFQQVGKDFPVFLHPETKDEHALARVERKTGAGHTGFAVEIDGVTLEDDLSRRDLTINAMALAEDGALVDPFGGADDLADEVLRHVGPAFSEDPLRVLRVARFAARFGFSVAVPTMQLMARMVRNGDLSDLTGERVWLETEKALATDRPSVFFRVLRACGALAVVFPEVDALVGQTQPVEHHPEGDAFEHTMQVLDQAARLTKAVDVRFAALVHDLGKGLTPADALPRHRKHEDAGVPLVKALAARVKVPAKLRDLGVLAAADHTNVHRLHQLKPGKVINLLKKLRVRHGLGLVQKLALIATVDARGRGPGNWDRVHPNGRLLMKLARAVAAVQVQPGAQGPIVGIRLRQDQCDAVRAVRPGKPD